MGGKSNPPPAPDYKGAAEQTAAGNLALNQSQTTQNRPNQFTPFGSSTWTNTKTKVPDIDAYTKAISAWNAQPAEGTTAGHWEQQAGGGGGSAGTGVDGSGYSTGNGGVSNTWVPGQTIIRGAAPTQDQFKSLDQDNWTQNISLNPAEQANLDAKRRVQSGFNTTAEGLLGKVQSSLSGDLNFDGLPRLTNDNYQQLSSQYNAPTAYNPTTNFNPNVGNQFTGNPNNKNTSSYATHLTGQRQLDPGFGAVQQVQDAMMSRLAPGRAEAREAELQRLRNQGLGDNTEAYQRALLRLDKGDTDARQQALLGATGEYGNIFNRGLQANAQNASNFDSNFQRDFNTNNQIDNRFDKNFNRQFDISNQGNQLASDQFGRGLAAEQFKSNNFGANFSRGSGLFGDNFNRGLAANNQTQGQNTLGAQLRQQGIGERQTIRQSSLNDLMRLLGGGAAPLNFPSFVQSGKVQGVDYSGAANQQYSGAVGNYNAGQAEQANLEKGLFSLAAAIAPAVIGSDRRIKSDIKFLGHHGGHKWYSYIKFGQPEIGVMAQDVMLYNPSAVLMHPSGYLMVNYGAL